MLPLSILVWHVREKCIVLLLQVFTINIKLVQILDYCLRLYILSLEKKERVSFLYIQLWVPPLSHSKSDYKLSPLPFALAWFPVTLVWLAHWTMIVENIEKVFKQTAWSWKSNFLFTLLSVCPCVLQFYCNFYIYLQIINILSFQS